jgi:outer membrane protein OmpA-like peptidoglycan-associated protein
MKRSLARDNLRKFAASLKKYPNTRTLIVGHTDSDGSAQYNMDLSDRRVLSAADLIYGEGVDRARHHGGPRRDRADRDERPR